MVALPTIPVDEQGRQTEEPQFHRVSFGDGYEVRSVMGINSIRRTVELQWKAVTREEANELMAFFRARRGVEVIEYALPEDEIMRQWRCHRYQQTRHSATTYDITAELEEHFG